MEEDIKKAIATLRALQFAGNDKRFDAPVDRLKEICEYGCSPDFRAQYMQAKQAYDQEVLPR